MNLDRQAGSTDRLHREIAEFRRQKNEKEMPLATQAVATMQVDNDRVRVTEWSFTPGAETGYHRHEYDYVVVPLMAGSLQIIGPDGDETVSEMNAGQSYFREAGVEHNVINASDGAFAFVEIELKS